MTSDAGKITRTICLCPEFANSATVTMTRRQTAHGERIERLVIDADHGGERRVVLSSDEISSLHSLLYAYRFMIPSAVGREWDFEDVKPE